MIQPRVLSVLCALLAVATATVELRADFPTFNTFGAGDAFSTSAPLTIGRPASTTTVVAAKFITTSTGTVNSVQLALGPTSPAGSPVTIHVRIFGHNATTNLPTAAVDTMQPRTLRLLGPQVVTFTSTQFPEFFSGTAGWLVVSIEEPVTSGQAVQWHRSPSATGPIAVSTNGGAFSLQGASLTLPAFRIVGEVLNGACCNPDTGQCILTGHFECTRWQGFVYTPGSVCNPQNCPAPCPADFNGSGAVSVQDVYDFLTAWNAACP